MTIQYGRIMAFSPLCRYAPWLVRPLVCSPLAYSLSGWFALLPWTIRPFVEYTGDSLLRCKKLFVFEVNSLVFYVRYVSTSAFFWNEFLQVYLCPGLITAWGTPRSIDSIRHVCKHSKTRKRTKKQKVSLTVCIMNNSYRPNDFIS